MKLNKGVLLCAMKFLVENNEYAFKLLDQEISLPNVPTKTAGGHHFWNTLAEYNGWKIQENMIDHHARILNDKNIRVAWGTVNGMYKAMKRLVDVAKLYHE